jgi:hypothetical protein
MLYKLSKKIAQLTKVRRSMPVFLEVWLY